MHGGGWHVGADVLHTHFGALTESLAAAVALVRSGLSALDLVDGPFLLRDCDGARRQVDLAPATHAAQAKLPEPIAVADLAPLGHPFAFMQSGARPVQVDYPGWSDAFERSFCAVAARLEQSGEPLRLIEALGRALAGHRFRSLLLPPILGVDNHERLRQQLESELGLEVAEALGNLPSPPGLRLASALRRWREEVGITCRTERATAVGLEPLRVETVSGSMTASTVILATGGLIPGGLSWKSGALTESLTGLPIALPLDLTTAVHRHSPHGGALFQAGLQVDEALRPIGPDGAALHPALYAVGDLLGGPDPVRDRCNSGRSILTGYVAAQAAADRLGDQPGRVGAGEG